MKKQIATLILGVIACLVFSVETGGLQAADRPNIVIFLCDDLGYGDLECYGHPHIKTPNLNRLADEGIRFTDCYSAAPVCSPSRVGLLTGRSPNRAGVFDWIPPGKKPLPNAREQVHMRKSETTIPLLLKSAGYATCMAGKWHCNSQFNDPDAQPQPGDHGFDHWLATQNNAAPSHENPKNFVRNGQEIGPVDAFSCQFVVSEAIDWLQQQSQQHPQQPFFIYIPFHEPHEPVASPPELVAKYRAVARTDDEAQFFANVENVDLAVGRFLEALAATGRADNTLVVFTSDNGPETLNRYRNANRSYGQAGPLRGMKLHTHDAGFRVAGIMRFPEKIAAGQVISSVPVSSLDLLPTCCALAETELPSRTLDGTSLLPLFAGEALSREKPLFWTYFNALNESQVAMRDGNYKVLARLDAGKVPRLENITVDQKAMLLNAKLTDLEVYDVTQDIDESDNLAEADPHLATQMLEKLSRQYLELLHDSHLWQPVQDSSIK